MIFHHADTEMHPRGWRQAESPTVTVASRGDRPRPPRAPASSPVSVRQVRVMLACAAALSLCDFRSLRRRRRLRARRDNHVPDWKPFCTQHNDDRTRCEGSCILEIFLKHDPGRWFPSSLIHNFPIDRPLLRRLSLSSFCFLLQIERGGSHGQDWSLSTTIIACRHDTCLEIPFPHRGKNSEL